MSSQSIKVIETGEDIASIQVSYRQSERLVEKKRNRIQAPGKAAVTFLIDPLRRTNKF